MKKKIIILLTILIIIGLVGYYYFNNSTPNPTNDDKPLSINDEKVKELYNYLQDNKLYTILNNNYNTVYQDKLITYNDLTKYTILRNIFYRLEKENASIDMYNTQMLSGNLEYVFNILDIPTIKYIDDCTPDNNDCIIPMSYYLNEVSGYYQINCDTGEMCIWFLNGNDNVNDEPLYKLTKVELVNDEYYLYDSVFYSDGKNLYNDYSKSNIVYTSPNDDLIKYDFVEENYKDCLYTYKHTFKKNNNGKYYWYSTELIK